MEKNKFYKFINNGILVTIWIVTDDERICYNMKNGEQITYPEDTAFENIVKNLTEIQSDEFNYLFTIWSSLKDMQNNIKKHPIGHLGFLENAVAKTSLQNFLDKIDKQLEEHIKKTENKRIRYHLYNVDSSISIFGYSDKTKEELAYFFETYARQNGARILDFDGITKGYVHPDLFNTLSYHIYV